MTYQEAKGKIQTAICCEKLVQHLCSDACLYGVEHCAFALAIAALEKQIPKKVTNIHCDEYYCPNCGAENNCDQHIVTDDYCPCCGQKLEVDNAETH